MVIKLNSFKEYFKFLIYSADTVGSDHYFSHRFTSVRPSSIFKISPNKRLVKIMITIVRTVGLAEGIIDDTCLVPIIFTHSSICEK